VRAHDLNSTMFLFHAVHSHPLDYSRPLPEGEVEISVNVANSFNFVSPFGVDAREDVIQHPMKLAQVNALDHTHVVERDVKAVLLNLLELATVVSGEAEGDESVTIRPFHCFKNVRTVP
jgi:rRNA maturation protein Rpf1